MFESLKHVLLGLFHGKQSEPHIENIHISNPNNNMSDSFNDAMNHSQPRISSKYIACQYRNFICNSQTHSDTTAIKIRKQRVREDNSFENNNKLRKSI